MTRDPLKLNLWDGSRTGKFDFPIISKYTGLSPERLIPFNYAKSNMSKNVGVHFFIDDYQFERVWRYPDRYVQLLNQYDCVLSPDFSVYVDIPLALKIWNIYRNRVLGHYWQRNGINVIPTLQWADYRTFDFCFQGIEPGGTVAVSTLGSAKNPMSKRYWIEGMRHALEELKPNTILLYGIPIDFDFGNIPVVNFQNQVINRLQNKIKL